MVVFPPSGPVPAGTQLSIATSGGDLVRANATDWYYFSNADSPQLYVYSTITGQAVALGSPAAGAPFISGMVSGEAGRLWAVSSGSDELIEIDPGTGQLGTRIPLCEACPTPYDLLNGDTTLGL